MKTIARGSASQGIGAGIDLATLGTAPWSQHDVTSSRAYDMEKVYTDLVHYNTFDVDQPTV